MSADKLQACLDRIARGEEVETVLQELRADAETRALVHLALAAGDALPVKAPSPMRARQQAALQEMMAAQVASASTGPDVSSPFAWRRLLVRFAGLAMAASLALGSAVAVSAESLPGDTLYGVKRAAESARVALTVAPIARAKLRSSLAVERLAELRALVDRGVMPAPEDLERLLAAHEALRRDAALAGEEDIVASATRQGEELAAALRAMASDLADTEPAAADRLDAAASSVAPPAPSAEQPEGGGGEGSEGSRAGDGGQGQDEEGGGASAGAQDPAPTLDAPQEDAAPVAQQSPTAIALSSATPALAIGTATPTVLPSATPRTLASATPASSGGGEPRPTAPPSATEPAPPPTAPPAPSAVPPTSVPPTSAAPPDPTAESIPNPRGTERAATRTAGTAGP